jgi:hypothetical protein
MNPRTHEVELPVVADMQSEAPGSGRRSPTCPAEPPRTAEPEQEGAPVAEEPRKPRAEPEGDSFRFDDPYWDDAFDSYHDPTLRTCCRS